MSFISRLETRARQADSLLCVGLDPHLPDLPAPTAEAAGAFCLRLVEATAEFAAAFKPNSAFFEVFGPQGMAVLKSVIAAIPDGIPVILDAKRGDIASSAEGYARAGFQTLGADAITASPYLGRDSLEPFLADPEHGVFLLCKTSNAGAGDLQDLLTAPDGRPLFERVALLAQAWNTSDNLGLVVGATHPEALRQVRAAAPGLWFLSPGVGAQGGELAAALQAGLRSDGLGMLIPVSRGLSRAADPRRAARELRDQINCQRRDAKYCVSTNGARSVPGGRGPNPRPLPDTGRGETIPPSLAVSAREGGATQQSCVRGDEKGLADGLLAAGCVKFGKFTLKSGLESPIYIDLRTLVSYPILLAEAAFAYAQLLQGVQFDRIAALPYAALPIATAISLQTGWPMIYPRKEAKAYGTRAEIEGLFSPGEVAAVVDDLTTTGGSKLEAIEKLTAAGLIVRDVVVLIDRQSGAAESLAQPGLRLHTVFTLSQLLDTWEANGKVPVEQIAAARAFIEKP